jgi:tetratricopeptide (TPR) repeat protein
VIASQCWMAGRIEAAVGYSEAAQTASRNGGDGVPFGAEGLLPGVYIAIGHPERSIEWCRTRLARGRDTNVLSSPSLVLALTVAGSNDEAITVAKGLTEAAEATRNPWALSFALFSYGYAFSDADSVRALDALRRGMLIAQDSGNRANESFFAITLARLEAKHGDPLAALEYVTRAIRNYHDSGNVAIIRSPLAILASLLDRLGCREPRHHRRLRVRSHFRGGVPRNQHRDRPPARSPRRPDLRGARPQGRDDDHDSDGDLCIRPNRRGPSRTELGLKIDLFRDAGQSGTSISNPAAANQIRARSLKRAGPAATNDVATEIGHVERP